MRSPPSRRLIALDGLAALGFILLAEMTVLRPPGQGSGATAHLLVTAGTALPIVVRRLWPVPAFLAVLVMSFVALPFGIGPASFLAAAYALYLVAVTQPAPRWPSTGLVGAVSAAGAVGLTVAGTPSTGGTAVSQILLGVVVVGAAWTAGRAVSERRENVRRAIEGAAERATIEERLRIAREMHDVVTHSMGLIAVKAGVANHVVHTRPEEAADALAVIEAVSRSALREMRGMLGVLRATEDDGPPAPVDLHPAPRLADLPALVETAEATGVQVDLAVHLEDDLPGGIEMSGFRIVQEALSNVARHAAPTRCRVSVVAEAGQMRIEVVDDGPRAGHRSAGTGGGYGLVGIRERAAAHGGSVTAAARVGGGFTVAAVLRY